MSLRILMEMRSWIHVHIYPYATYKKKLLIHITLETYTKYMFPDRVSLNPRLQILPPFSLSIIVWLKAYCLLKEEMGVEFSIFFFPISILPL